MKLKTEVRQGDDMVVPIAAGDEFDQFNAYCHDAAAAHALVKALAFFEDQDPQAAEWIEERADKFMASWGYREE